MQSVKRLQSCSGRRSLLLTKSHPRTTTSAAFRVRMFDNPTFGGMMGSFTMRPSSTLLSMRNFATTTPQTSSTLTPWKVPMVESHGDYRDETFLEDTTLPLYKNQSTLPSLPIPTIEDTLQRFVPTALPLCRSNDERDQLQKAIDTFPQEAAPLQERLIERQAAFSNSSWLQLWWNQLGYLQVRDSVVINVSYFFDFKDDPTIHPTAAAISDDTTRPNVKRAAAILFATAEFRNQVASGSLPAETVGRNQTPLCATAYKYMFHACRIPRSEQDSYRIYDPSKHHHVIVARKGQFFSIPLVDGESGDPMTLETFETLLEQCIVLADDNDYPQLGLLTSSNRNHWATARSQLMDTGSTSMESALAQVESGAIMLTLDETSPVSRHECGEVYLSGGTQSGPNRWFDKSIQIMVQENGKAGILGEHSMMDGMPLVSYADYVTGSSYRDAKARSDALASSPTAAASAPTVTDIFGKALEGIDNDIVDQLVQKARVEFTEHVGRHSNTAQSFQAYGSDFIKQSGHSPDAYVQIAIQLATYRLFGEQVGTYEATQVRPFRHGRTETTRSVSVEGAALLDAMGLAPLYDEGDNNVRQHKRQLLEKATKAHAKYTRTAAQAQGVDRHFFGLGMALQDNENAPVLLSDPVFARSKKWRVSTSHLTHPNFVNWGFGQVVPDGVGIGYSILPDSCVFNIYSLKETGWTFKLAELVEESLLELRRLHDADATPQSKL